MDPTTVVNLALAALNEILSLIANIKGQAGLTTDQLVAQADQLDLANKEAIKALLAL